MKQEYLVGPGTTCFKARALDLSDKELVGKFVWNQIEGSAERRLLQLANDGNVWGVLRLQGYQDLGDTARLRQDLEFGQPYKFLLPLLEIEDSDKPQIVPELTPNFQLLTQTSSGLIEHKKESKFENLKFECIMTSPLGRPLHTFSSPSELITILRDIIKALRSLYLKTSILHRNISVNNIIISPNIDQDSDVPTRMLIDLDLALNLSNPPSKQKLVGLEGYMATGILGGDHRTYRHDLESVFYVFLWMAICHHGATPDRIPDKSRLYAWRGTDFLASFRSKKKDMQPMEFLRLVEEEFTGSFKPHIPLAITTHRLLFPIRNGRILMGTDYDSDSPYKGMIAGFECYINC